MTAAEKITRAKVQLILKEPFFATLILSMLIVEDNETKTASTNGERIKYNTDFVDSTSIDELIEVLCHEILHITGFHHTRRNDRDAEQWNRACDYAINPILLDAGFKLPKGALLDNQFKNMPAEKIFSLLPAPKPDDKKQPGEVEDSPAKTEGEKQEKEAQIKQNVIQAAQAAKRAGKLTAALSKLIETVLAPVINWKEVLNRFVCETAHNDYSFKKPNPRFIHSGFYLPSLHNEEPGKIVLIVDTSASIDDDLLNQFGAELQEVCNSMSHALTVIYVDTEVKGIQEIEPDEEVKLNAIGRGGTDFAPGFDYIEEHQLEPKAVIYFTDGECHNFAPAPDYPVLWAKYGAYNFKPPYGEIVKVD